MLRKYGVGLLALAVAFGAVAFTAQNMKRRLIIPIFSDIPPQAPGRKPVLRHGSMLRQVSPHVAPPMMAAS